MPVDHFFRVRWYAYQSSSCSSHAWYQINSALANFAMLVYLLAHKFIISERSLKYEFVILNLLFHF